MPIIYTSGSTGEPKGVAVSHQAAVNTLLSCVRLFGIHAEDRLLAISQFNFDLSVFDWFTPSLIGCSMVLVDDSDINDQDRPDLWLQTANQFSASVWNSVPAIIEMAYLYNQSEISQRRFTPSLRLFMASGDWIPTRLPAQIKSQLPQAQFICLGGATEAAIWSNYYQVAQSLDHLTSIPYGKPLDNQRYYVLDQHLRPCPRGVAGGLYIAGKGLADCYFNNRQATAAAFIEHLDLQQRLYNTGDQGRYLEDGNIEFLGRIDQQVKINGFRVELGEIEQQALQAQGVKQALALYDRNGDSLLHLFVVLAQHEQPDTVVIDSLKKYLKQRFSDCMLPQHYHVLPQLPLSGNGKVDRSALQARLNELHSSQASQIEAKPPTSDQQQLLLVCQKVLPWLVAIEQNWFNCGCNSLQALHLLHHINLDFDVQLQLTDIYRHPSVLQLAERLKTGQGDNSNVTILHQHPEKPLHLVIFTHPVGGEVSCYFAAAEQLKSNHDVLALSANMSLSLASIESMAYHYYQQLRPDMIDYKQLTLVGWSLGGAIALEMAKHCQHDLPESVVKVVKLDTYVGHTIPSEVSKERLVERFIGDLEAVEPIEIPEPMTMLTGLDPRYRERFDLFERNYVALTHYHPTGQQPNLYCLQASKTSVMEGLQPLSTLVPQAQVSVIKGDHFSVITEPQLWLEKI